MALITSAALIGGGVVLYRWWQGRKQVKNEAGEETNVTVKRQEQAERSARATELLANKDDREYKNILLAIGISEKKLAAGAITPDRHQEGTGAAIAGAPGSRNDGPPADRARRAHAA